jgi:THO complex subunit 4
MVCAQEAFETQIGRGSVLRTFIHYDRSGRSKGSGEVIFASRQEAQSAIRQLNGLELEGKVLQLTLTNTGSGDFSRGGFNRRTSNNNNFVISANLRNGGRR